MKEYAQPPQFGTYYPLPGYSAQIGNVIRSIDAGDVINVTLQSLTSGESIPAIAKHVRISISTLDKSSLRYQQILDEEYIMQKLQEGNPDFHPHCYGIVQEGMDIWLFMDMIEGQDLSQQRLPFHHAISAMGQVLDQLDYAHEKGIFHRDIKPDNIVGHINSPTDNPMEDTITAKVVDWALASTEEFDHTATCAGSISYMAPEKVYALLRPKDRKDSEKMADLYALAKTMFELITGKTMDDIIDEDVPYREGERRDMYTLRVFRYLAGIQDINPQQHINHLMTELEEVVPNNPSFLAFMQKALAFDPATRYQSASEMKKGLMQAAA